MPTEPPTTRRALLRAAGATLASAGLAGCVALPRRAGRTPAATPAPVPPSETPTPPRLVGVELVDYTFEPGTDEPLVVPRFTAVRFVWRTGGHNLVVGERPAAADWAGHERVENARFAHEHVFAVPGRYEFWCAPHRSLGMAGTIVVE